MQNKTKLFLISVVVFGFGFLMTEKTHAAVCVCGSAISSSYSTAPTSNLCSTGTASSVTSDSGYWQWSCTASTCDSVTCEARKAVDVNACSCGSSNGQSFSSAPTANLCSEGTAATITGSGPWTWSCTGTCGASASCSANKTSGSTPTTLTIPTNTGLPTNTKLVKGIFENVANFLLSIIGIIAIISFVISGIQYFLVATDEKMMETAKKTMVASIIGLVVALFGYIAIKTVEMLLKG
jgi:hypothetical protein